MCVYFARTRGGIKFQRMREYALNISKACNTHFNFYPQVVVFCIYGTRIGDGDYKVYGTKVKYSD